MWQQSIACRSAAAPLYPLQDTIECAELLLSAIEAAQPREPIGVQRFLGKYSSAAAR